jgi:hypothetical protein
VKSFLPFAADQQRSKELRQLLAVADEVVGWRNPTVIMLARAEIVATDSDSAHSLTDLDGMLGFFRDGQLNWLVVETKHAGGDDGGKQLTRNLFPALLSAPTAKIQTRTFGSETAWFIVLPSPDPLPLPTVSQ